MTTETNWASIYSDFARNLSRRVEGGDERGCHSRVGYSDETYQLFGIFDGFECDKLRLERLGFLA